MIELQNKLDILKSTLTNEQQKLLSFNSIQNFIWSFDKLKIYKTEVYVLLVEYFEIIESENYFIDKKNNTVIAFDYVLKIGIYYTKELGFKVQMKLLYAFMIGIHLDVILLLTGVLKFFYYLPVITILLLSRWWYLKEFHEKRHNVHGVRY